MVSVVDEENSFQCLNEERDRYMKYIDLAVKDLTIDVMY